MGGLEKWTVVDTRDSKIVNLSFKHMAGMTPEDVPEVTVYIPTYDGKLHGPKMSCILLHVLLNLPEVVLRVYRAPQCPFSCHRGCTEY